MKATFVIAAAIGLTLAGAAVAQPARGERGPVATLYEFPNFQGRQVSVYGSEANLSGLRFNDTARSARFRGSWRVCEHADFGGRCAEARGDIADLNQIGMSERISSIESGENGWRQEPWDRGGGWDRDGDWDRREGRGVEGAVSVFFARPTIRGADIAAGGTSANAYCRRMGLGPAVYFDSSQRSSRAVDWDGRPIGDSSVLRDLLCRRR